MSFRKMIEDETGGEKIIGVVIGKMGWGNYGSERVPGYETHPRGKLLCWADAVPLLEYNFDSGFGAPRCEAIFAWTENRVIFIGMYDGSTWATWVPRHPCDCMPYMVGG